MSRVFNLRAVWGDGTFPSRARQHFTLCFLWITQHLPGPALVFAVHVRHGRMHNLNEQAGLRLYRLHPGGVEEDSHITKGCWKFTRSGKKNKKSKFSREENVSEMLRLPSTNPTNTLLIKALQSRRGKMTQTYSSRWRRSQAEVVFNG